MTTRLNYQGASPTAIQHHYDRSNDFYGLWLDPTRTYSCALWEGPEDTLQAAQERKLDYLVRGALAPGAGRVLDVGCGWGGLMRRLVEHHDVDQVVGLTLSDAQADYARQSAGERCEVRVENWTDHQPAARAGQPDTPAYDAIVSIGAFEHFASFGMTRAMRIEAYRRFFVRCREWLPERGRLSLQTCTKGSNVRMDRQMVRDLLFIVDHIFPESEMPWPSEIFEASERIFEVVSVRNDADHYARTCEEWLAGLRANKAAAEQLVGEQRVAEYERYLSASIGSLRNRHQGLMRLVFERV